MLLRFGVRNFRSIRDTQELSLVASSLDDTAGGLIDCPAIGSCLLPAIVLYGANASGKTNVVRALRWMRQAVLQSQTRFDANAGVPRERFALAPSAETAETLCDLDFVLDSVRYHYGFTASDEAFTREWLYAFPSGRRQVLFEREGKHFEFGRHLRGRNRVIADLTRPNSLFLSAARQNDHEELSRISNFFRSFRAEPARPSATYENIDPRAVAFLQDLATGVVGFRRTKVDPAEDAVAFIQALFKLIAEQGALSESELNRAADAMRNKRYKLELAHSGQSGQQTFLGFDDESDGTQRLLLLLTPAFRALDEGALMVVDELDASLHTRACEALLALFALPKTNPKGAQLIATTHDTNLLRSRYLRRDQVWFTEKDANGATHLYPLTDFRTRKGDNLERGYLQGRYGAIPFSGLAADILASV